MMKILIVSPLYPPDIAEPAPHVKELAKRLHPSHCASIATYGRFPEKIDGVLISTIDKRSLLPVRLFMFTKLCFRLMKDVDMVYVENGPSSELPVLIASFFVHTNIVLHIGDEAALLRTKHNVFHKIVHIRLAKRAHLLPHRPDPRPELLPFEDVSLQKDVSYEKSWKVHMQDLNSLLTIHA